MNPSTSGWIDKFGHIVQEEPDIFTDYRNLYNELKKIGFVYGVNTQIPRFIKPEHKLSEDEKAKINLLTALYYVFKLETGNTDFEAFLDRIFQFYKDLEVDHISFLNKILVGNKTSSQLEKLIDSRVFIEDNVISKTFNSIITSSLLFIDALLFKRYLSNAHEIRQHAQSIEHIALNITYHALNSKEKHKSDEKLAQLFASSLTFINGETQSFDGSYRGKLLNSHSIWENNYFLDMACLTVWEDHSLDYKESEFIFSIGKDLGFDKKQISRALEEITSFFDLNSTIIPFLKDNNLAVQFYNNMSRIVNKLIIRNSKRLQKELSESKELVTLLSKSTVKDLTADEKKKVQKQLLDIFKSIPSLAIFLLPGGALLLPIFIKLVPTLLPSSFDDNRIEKPK